MNKTAIAVTSSGCLDYHSRAHSIYILRQHVHMDDQSFVDGRQIKAQTFQQWMLDNPEKIPSTTPPSLSEMIYFFGNLMKKGYQEVLILCISSRLAKVHEMLLEVRKLFAGRLAIHVFDTQTASFSEGMLALKAEKLLRRGFAMPDIISHLESLRDRSTTFITVGTLSYLIKNGRLSATAGMIANLIDIKPVLQITDGEVKPVARIRTFDKALENMADLMAEFIGKNHYEAYLMTSGVEQTNLRFAEILRHKYRIENLPSYPMSPVVAAHAGPNAVGMSIMLRSRTH